MASVSENLNIIANVKGEIREMLGASDHLQSYPNAIASAMTDEPLPSEWSGVRPVADGASIKDGVAFLARIKGKTVGGVNSQPEAIVSGVGRNLWNEQWKLGTLDGEGKEAGSSRQIINVGYIPIPKDKTLYICGKTATLNFYDENKVHITRYTSLSKTKDCIIDLPEGTRYIRFRVDDTTSYVNPICINISDSENGTYSPWVESRLDIVLPSIFADGLASAGDIYDEIDYLHNVAIRRVGVADLGTLTWTHRTEVGQGIFSATLQYKFRRNTPANCSAYAYIGTVEGVSIMKNADNKSLALYHIDTSTTSRSIYIKDTAYSSAADFKAAMSGVYLFYELVEPIGSTIDAKAWYKVESGGSEEAVCGNGVPLVAEIAYRKDYTETINDYELAKTLI